MAPYSQYSPSFLYSQPPLPAEPVYNITPENLAAFINSSNMSVHLARENARLQFQLQQKALREEAYMTTISSNGKTMVLTESGRATELLSDCIAESFMVVRSGPISLPVQIWLLFSAHTGSIILEEAEFLNDKLLLHKLQSSGVGVVVRKSTRQTAALIRQLVTKVMRPVELSFYAGWMKATDKNPRFLPFDPFSSHQRDSIHWKPPFSGKRLPIAAERATVMMAVNLFTPVCDEFLRWFLFQWFHGAFLFSLLPAAGKSLPLGVCFYSQDPVIQTWLQMLLTWYGDPAINLSAPTSDFLQGLWTRKDQPLVILETQSNSNAAKNTTHLENILAVGRISFQNHAESATVPLQAPITLISSTISPLSSNPDVLVMDISSEAINRSLCRSQQWNATLIHEYLQVFAAFVEDRWSDFLTTLDEGYSTAQTLCTMGTSRTLEALGTLIGISKFTATFLAEQDPDMSSVWSDEEAMFRKLADQLEGLAYTPSSTDLAAQFCQLAQKCLREKIYVLCPEGRDSSGDIRPPVYQYRGDYAFSARAFREMCQKLGASTVQVSRALSEANLLRGKATNATTVQTRISLFNAHGISRWEGVYRIAGDAIEFGDII